MHVPLTVKKIPFAIFQNRSFTIVSYFPNSQTANLLILLLLVFHPRMADPKEDAEPDRKNRRELLKTAPFLAIGSLPRSHNKGMIGSEDQSALRDLHMKFCLCYSGRMPRFF